MKLLPVAALVLCACNSVFDPQYLVTDLRVLAIRAQVQGSTLADGSPGQTLTIDALVANPVKRAGVTVTWYACLPADNESLPPCADPAFLADPARLASDPDVIPLGACEPSQADGVCGVTVPLPNVEDAPALADALAFMLNIALNEPAYQCRLYAEMPVVAVLEAEGYRDVALKRVRITPDPADLVGTVLEGAYAPNQNPTAIDVVRAPTDTRSSGCVGGIAIDADHTFPAGETVLCATASSDSVEKFNVCGPNGERTETPETLSWQWFATGGEFPDFGGGIGNVTGHAVDFVRPPGPFRFWAVVRDGRGGESWLQRYVAP
jgi:hypothetical protein